MRGRNSQRTTFAHWLIKIGRPTKLSFGPDDCQFALARHCDKPIENKRLVQRTFLKPRHVVARMRGGSRWQIKLWRHRQRFEDRLDLKLRKLAQLSLPGGHKAA